jgi:hypothetical protein
LSPRHRGEARTALTPTLSHFAGREPDILDLERVVPWLHPVFSSSRCGRLHAIADKEVSPTRHQSCCFWLRTLHSKLSGPITPCLATNAVVRATDIDTNRHI